MIEWPKECIEWDGYRHKSGYGQTSKIDGRQHYAHRRAWEMIHGPIPDGLHVLHSCDNPPCVNVAHLHLGTHADNMREANERDRIRRRKNTYGGEWKSKLGLEQVAEIRAALLLGCRPRDLAKLFEVSSAVIGQIARGKNWVSR